MGLVCLVELENIKSQVRYIRDIIQRDRFITPSVKDCIDVTDILHSLPGAITCCDFPLVWRVVLTLYIMFASCVIWQDAPLSPIQISILLSIDCTANALGRYLLENVVYPVLGETLVPDLGALTGNPLVKLLDRMPLEDSDSPGREN